MHSFAYFAYGSNTNTETLGAYLLRYDIDPSEITNSRRAILPNHRLRTNYCMSNSWGAVNIEPAHGATVEGVLMTITPAVHKILRRKEGWPHRYVEIPVLVCVPRQRGVVMAMTYRVARACRLPFDMPVHSSYRDTILRGAERFRFSQRYQRTLGRILQTA